MNPVHRPESRVTTGLQVLFKKYRRKKLAIKIKWLDMTEENSARGSAGGNGKRIRKRDLVH
ncbi:hypothetical protein [Aeromonas veronii]|uniref:hypothetical protein n=1 Tax=Aeromonas veronii TaxID=654 RepID=UPI003B9FD09B